MQKRHQVIRQSRRLHRVLLWPALIAMAVFIVSGFMHILVTWTGPQAQQSQPPRAVFSASEWVSLPTLLQRHGIGNAVVAKLVPSRDGNVLQITTDDKSPRHYIAVNTGEVISDYDQQHALWLARHYLGSPEAEPVAMEFLTDFDSSYPWVNRLLPVYRFHFAGADNLTVTVHTETGALADISNNWKRCVQNVFQHLHTWKWLDGFPLSRIVLMMVLLSSLLGMILAGAGLLLAMKRRSIAHSSRRWHRTLAHVVWVPLFGFTASGTYHLLHNEYAPPVASLRLGPSLALANVIAAPVSAVLLPDAPLQSLALLPAANGTLLYRASIGVAVAQDVHHGSAAPAQHNQQRNARFDGIAKEQAAVYVDVATGVAATVTDEQMAKWLVSRHVGLRDDTAMQVTKITRFGPGYDFRNKRLPVWQVTVSAPLPDNTQDTFYVDVATGILVDSSNPASRAEGWSFSTLHKWNFLTPLTGREWRDGLIVLALSLAMVTAAVGFNLRKKSHV